MWNLYEGKKFLEPLKFSNNKTQEDVVREVLQAIDNGNKVIFIHGICGTGKSAIALNIARKLGKASVIVPGKSLQAQYKKDYEKNKYLLKNNKEKLKISVITGRNNHKCKFLEDNQNAIPKIKTEINSKLHDIFLGKKEEIQKTIGKDISADNKNIPCKIEIKEKNWSQIKKYLKQNEKVNFKNFDDIKDVKRISIGSVCPYWCPVLPEEYEAKILGETKRKIYTGIGNVKFAFHQRKPGCKFYEQFNSYIDSDVIVFNSMKYLLESLLKRKPLTEVEIVDECDEFLDNFSNQKNINIDRLQNSLIHIATGGEKVQKTVKEIAELIKQLKKDKRISNSVVSHEIFPLKATGIYDLLNLFLNSQEFLDEADNESYLFNVEEASWMFKDFLDETYVTFNKKEENLIASLVTTNLAKKFKEMVDNNKIIILMSGTLHSRDVLKNIFGLEKFAVIEAETEKQGNIKVVKTGFEMDCRYSKLNNNREGYLKALDKCVEIAKKPVLIHVNAFLDLPSEIEIIKFGLNNLISREKLKELQINDKTGRAVEQFKEGIFDVLFTTKCGRGIDFPGEQCNSIVFTKYPNPNVKDSFWRILNKTKPQYYWSFYKDKARRELWQKIYRGLRFKEDKIYLLSPDSRVLSFFLTTSSSSGLVTPTHNSVER